MFGVPTRHIRIVAQALVFGLWVALITSTHHPIDSWLSRHVPVSLLLRLDPLVMTAVCGGLRMGVTITLLAAATVVVSALLGRVFCGWVCPLGTTFDAYGWLLRKLRVRFEGPSPSWFRFKYYLLVAILVFAILGGVSPLMGFDPIVIITRAMASVVGPLLRKKDELLWQAGGPVGRYGSFIDSATLVLFLAIMAGTTRLSRIWCRTACPLGAYLAVLSRHAVLRRQTQDCVRCNICATHCPTGAISFTNPEVYNESECIKCMACTQECPVDANFFRLSSPVPTATAAYAPVQLERRQFLTTTASAAVAIPILNLSAGEPNAHKHLLRPPMSREERDFLSSCIRCGECVKACPTGVLKPAGLQHGLRALWTPVMATSEAYCKPGCNACSQACPTDAILKYPIEQKYTYKAGTAVFNASRCISHTENKFCNECVKVCPTHAIKISKGWEPEGGRGADAVAPAGLTSTRPVHVSFDQCIGCGACEHACNQIVYGEPAMITTSFGRAVPSNLTGNSS